MGKEFEVVLTGEDILYISAILGETNVYQVTDYCKTYSPSSLSGDDKIFKDSKEELNNKLDGDFVQDKYLQFHSIMSDVFK